MAKYIISANDIELLKHEVSSRVGARISRDKEFSPICAYCAPPMGKMVVSADGRNPKLSNDEVIQQQLDVLFEVFSETGLHMFCIAWQEKASKKEGVVVIHTEFADGHATEKRLPYRFGLFNNHSWITEKITEEDAEALFFSNAAIDSLIAKNERS